MLIANDYYWVGGSGYWSDINHWATTSGGSVLHSQVPTANDNVYFDGNSFNANGDSIIINLKNAVCRDMDWSGVSHNPRLSGADTTSVRLFGSLKFNQNMVQDYNGDFLFEATVPGKTITTAGHTFSNNVIFNGEGGSWKLLDDLRCVNDVVLNKGALQTNGKELNSERFVSETQFIRTIDLSNSAINVRYWRVEGTNLTMNAMSAQFTVGSSLSNKNGTTLNYPDVHFTGMTAEIFNSNVFVTFQNLTFDYAGTILGDCNIHDVVINSFGIITGNDTIHNIYIKSSGEISGGSVINALYIDAEGSVAGTNQIKTVEIVGLALIDEFNEIETAKCFSIAKITGSNDFGYLSVNKQSFFSGENDAEEADLYGDGYFIGNNQFGTLNFFPGRTYIFNCHSTQTIRDDFHIDGTCNEPIRMFSDTNSVQAGIKKVHGAVTGQYLSLRDLKATDITPFRAFNSVDLGNNTGWNIETTPGLDLYWVNGQGNWSDNQHWDTQSGGAGGHCPPTEIDNAIFDGNSFSSSGQKVTLDIENAVCKDMLWKQGADSPVLFGVDTNNLHIYGSLTEIPALSWQFQGGTYFEATTPGQTIFTSGHIFIADTWFVGRGGSWDFLDNFNNTSTIYFQQGIINTLANDVVCNNFSSTDTTTRELHLSTTTWTMNGGGMNVWSLNAQNLTLSADSSLLISQGVNGNILSFGSGGPLVYNDVIFYDEGSQLLNAGVYCYYNVIDHYGVSGMIRGDCTIDSALFHNKDGLILDNDTIRAAIFDMKNGEIRGGNHQVQIAIFYDDGTIRGSNKVDTALFYRNGFVYDTNIIDTTIIYNKAIINGLNTIRTATLLGNGQFIGENEFHDLTLTKSSSYYLEHDKMQTVVENLYANGTCTGPIFIQSDENEQQAIIKKVNGTIDADYVQLRDIKGEGVGVPFTAYNSVDLGNNTNWNIYISSPKELFWVNGKGVWSDSLHWSDVSGGQGGNCIPTPIDNVYFDQNSFLDVNDTVFIDIGNATCHNMDWTGSKLTPVFYSPDTNFMRIYGGVKFNEHMILFLEGSLFFESTHSDNHILMRTKTFVSDVYFQGVGGEWQLDDAFSSNQPVYFMNGSFESNGQDLSVYAFNTNFTNQRSLNLDNSKITLTGGGIEAWYLNGLNINFSAENTIYEIASFNCIFRTDYGGPFQYPYLDFSYSGWVFNRSTKVSFDSIYFRGGGQVHGDCDIIKVRGGGTTAIYDSDNINSVNVYGGDFFLQGSHHVNNIVAGQDGTISGNNIVDTVLIGGVGILSGKNQINEVIEIGDEATIDGENFAHFAKLHGNGIFNGENEFDVLKFYPGNLYELEEAKIQTINQDFLVRGNNCFPITLRSQRDGQQAIITMPAGRTVVGDFIEIKDINATGGAIYYAGHYSTDLSNNNGWIFENAPGYIFGFANDTVACLGGETIIGTENFNPDENSTFLWHDGSTLSEYLLKGEDKVWVTVNYADNCSFTDTISISYKNSPQVELGTDKTMCSGDTVSIDFHSDSVGFVWSDGSTDSIIRITETGYYTITVINDGGCKASDSIFVNAIPSPEVILGPDTTIFSNQDFVLNAGNPGANYTWSTGESSQSITVNQEGEYWVAVSNGECTGYDTIIIMVYPDCILAVPNAFSPNGDGHNDLLYARGEGFVEMELMIFNRIGELVFNTKDNSIGWDGTFKGKNQPVETYMYMLKGVCVSGNSIFKKGNITLLR
jgi:gliding motility-associated-like protein